MKKITVSILSVMLMLSMVFSSSVFAAEKEQSAWDSFVGLFAAKAPAAESEVGVEYRGHIQNVGNYPLDGTWVQGPAELGTEGKGLRLEGFWIKLNGEVPADTHIQYQVHVQNVGWMDPVQDGAFAGTEGKSLQIEAIKIKLVDDNGDLVKDYSVVYSGHVQNVGDVGPFTNGEKLGTEGSFLRLEAIEVEIVQNKADLTAYEEALAAVKEADYTPASWAAYQEVVEANVVTEDSLQSEVDAATAAIVEAQKDLVELGEVVGIVAINATTVEVTFADDVTEVDKSEFVIDGLAVNNAAIKQTNKKVVVLTTAAQEGAKVYGLTYQGVDTGLTFTGISAVLPTAIKIADGTNFVTVGQEFTVTATVTTTEANKAGIPVTFNIDAPTGSLNQDIVVERLTDANGVATYTYTRYATDNDAVSVYPTGAAAVRDTRTISWSAQPLLSVSTSETNTIVNGAAKTYTVTLRNQVTGNPVGAGSVIRVLFNENIGTINNTTASATDVSNATTVVPFQRATGAATTLDLTTNASGTVTFSVTGSNTKATPIIFIDNTATPRLDATDLQLWAPQVTFQGAQISDQITVTPETEATIAASANRGRVYTMEVKKPDGTAFAGGVVQVAFNELIDNNLGTNTNAVFVWSDSDNNLRTTASTGVVAGVQAPTVPAGFPRQMTVQLNDSGKATFMIANATQAQVATPIVWIDQDSTTAVTNHVLEATEPSDLGGVTVTEGQTVTSADLDINQASQGVNTNAVVTYTTRDQNGAAYIAGGDGAVRITYTIANTGANVLTVSRNAAADNTDAGTWSVNGAGNAAVAPGTALTTINPGMSATIAVTQTAGQNNSNLVVTAAAPTTYTVSAQGLTTTTNKSLAAAAKTGTFVNEVNVDAITIVNGQTVTGTITAFDTADANYDGATSQSGRIKISVDGQPGQFAWFTYNSGRTNNAGVNTIDGITNDNLFVGNDSTFNANTPATNAQFEAALSVGNKVRITANGAANRLGTNAISLYNVNATDNTSQINQTLPVDVAIDNILSSVANDTDFDGFYDALVVTFNQNVNAPTVEIGDFTIPGATVQTVNSTGNAVVNVTIADGVLPITAQFPTITVNGITLANGTVVTNEQQVSTNIVAPWITTATTVQTNATATINSLGQNVVVGLEGALATSHAGAFGNLITVVVADGAGASTPAALNWNAGTNTLTVTSATDAGSAVIPLTLLDVATLIDGHAGFTAALTGSGTPVVPAAAPAATFTGGTDVVTIDFAKYVDAASIDLADATQDFTFSVGGITATSVVTDADTVTTTITAANAQVKQIAPAVSTVVIANGAITSDTGANTNANAGTAPNTVKAVN